MKTLTIIIFLLSLSFCFGEGKRVLFLGNSYTFYNGLPGLVETLSKSAGKDIIVESNTPGGMTIEGHLANSATMQYIRAGNWDYVVLQEQSQLPTIDYYRYGSMYPAMAAIADSIRKYSPCAVIVTYMTWGRRFGGKQCDPSGEHCSPDFRDFSHMQDSLESAYIDISDKISAAIAPVGIAWKQVIEKSKYVLHDIDDSHPNLDGSYLAACVFYGIIHNDRPINIMDNMTLVPEKAEYFRSVADQTVFGSKMKWNTFYNYPVADFDYSTDQTTVTFKNISLNPENANCFWDFGDGKTSSDENPTHNYDSDKNFEVRLIIEYCGKSDTASKIISVSSVNIPENSIEEQIAVNPNPAVDYIEIHLNPSEGSKPSEGSSIRIYNALGECVKTLETGLRPVSTKIDISRLPPGLYFLNTGKQRSKFIKE